MTLNIRTFCFVAKNGSLKFTTYDTDPKRDFATLTDSERCYESVVIVFSVVKSPLVDEFNNRFGPIKRNLR